MIDRTIESRVWKLRKPIESPEVREKDRQINSECLLIVGDSDLPIVLLIVVDRKDRDSS